MVVSLFMLAVCSSCPTSSFSITTPPCLVLVFPIRFTCSLCALLPLYWAHFPLVFAGSFCVCLVYSLLFAYLVSLELFLQNIASCLVHSCFCLFPSSSSLCGLVFILTLGIGLQVYFWSVALVSPVVLSLNVSCVGSCPVSWVLPGRWFFWPDRHSGASRVPIYRVKPVVPWVATRSPLPQSLELPPSDQPVLLSCALPYCVDCLPASSVCVLSLVNKLFSLLILQLGPPLPNPDSPSLWMRSHSDLTTAMSLWTDRSRHHQISDCH